MEADKFKDFFEKTKSKIQQSLFAEALDDIRFLLLSDNLDAIQRVDLAYQQITSLNYLGSTKEAMLLSEKNLQFVISNNLEQKLATANILSGRSALILSDYEKAQAFFSQAFFYAKQYKDYYSLIDALSHMGIILSMTNQPKEAIGMFIHSLRVIKEHEGSVVNKTDAYFRLGNILCELGKYHLGFKFINEAERLANESNNQINILNTLLTKVHVLESVSKYKEAMVEVKKAIAVNKRFKQDILDEIINFYFCNVVLKGQLKYHLKDRIARLIQSTEVESKTQNKAEYIETIILYCRKKRDYKKLDHFQELRFALNKEFYNETSDKNLKKLQSSFDIDLLKQEKKQAEQIAKVKHEFLANMSHEIRSPMNMVLGALNLVLDDKPTAKQAAYLYTAKRGAENLLGTINDFLDLSKIEAGKIEILTDCFDLYELIHDLIKLFKVQSKSKGLKLGFNYSRALPRLVVADEYRIRQVLTNLLSNAIKFTEKGSVHISASHRKVNNEEEILLLVQDTGIGLSAESQSKIFNEYQQAERETSKLYGGTGLGLFISKNLCELMGGKMKVTSVQGEGSSFEVIIPVKTDTKTIKKSAKLKHQALQNLKIIIADDMIENRKILRDTILLYSKNVCIVEAENGEVLLDKLKKDKFDVVITDLDMPKLNGFEFIKIFRSQDKTTKVLAMTASLISGSTSQVLALGFDKVIFKPFKPEALISVIGELTN